MKTASAEILDWASKLDYWEKAAFKLLISKKEVTDKEVDILCDLFLQDHMVEPIPSDREKINFEDNRSSEENFSDIQLVKISNLRNINALVANQSLEFGDRLTAVFGGNGSGKSGYARVLGSAGFTRGDDDIIRDITKQYDIFSPQTVDIQLKTGGQNFLIQHEIGKHCHELASFYVFDSTSVIVHLTKENTISFSPTSLSQLQNLSALTDKVRERLKKRIEDRLERNKFSDFYIENTIIKEKIDSLSHDSDIEELMMLATLTETEREEYKKVKNALATIETKGVSEKISELRKEIDDLKILYDRIECIISLTNQETIDALNKEIYDYNTSVYIAKQLGLDKFKEGSIISVGSEEWYKFLVTSKYLAHMETPDRSYPQDGSLCLLCQQPLSEEAKELISQLFNFLESDIQQKIEKHKKSLDSQNMTYYNLGIDFIDEELAITRVLKNRDEKLEQQIKAFRDNIIQLRRNILEGINLKKTINITQQKENNLKRLIDLEGIIQNKIRDWEKKEGEKEYLKNQKLLYEHRQLLSTQIDSIIRFHENLVWLNGAVNIKSSTRHITRQYNKLFSKLVSDEYINLFEATLYSLGRPLKVRIETKGKKSEVYKQLVLEANESTPDKFKNPDKILSEGEKRAVALADFLTEINLDPNSRGIILDDPITSLDMQWRKNIAEVLVGFAENRQVIVFTHDLPFLSFLNEAANQNQIPIDNHWIKRGEQDDCPGYIFLYNSPALEYVYKNAEKAEDYYRKAKCAGPEQQLDLIRAGFGALRTSFEVLIMNCLFQGVVKRFDEITHFMRLNEIAWDDNVVSEIVENCGICSRHMEGHSHSDIYFDKRQV
jgi:ABC-type dipeptide/oligopeptide/nickel transport system ATPase component